MTNKKRSYENSFADLISIERLKMTSVKKREPSDEFLSDKGRVITSSALRRLQAKAQVFSLEENAAVRTRLTHSYEVSSLGEIIASKVFQKLKKQSLIASDMEVSFITAVETACLLHDIGNPPFGHFGEFAIRAWLKREEEKLKAPVPTKQLKEWTRHFDGLSRFDGNSQGFRILTRLQWHKNQYGLNLTCTQLGACIKYPFSVPPPEKSKIGFFEVDKSTFERICEKLKYSKSAMKHPLSYIMEAADDIAYCLSDIEDGIEKGIVTPMMFFKEIDSFFGKTQKSIEDKKISTINLREAKKTIRSLRVQLLKDAHQLTETNRERREEASFIEFKIRVTRWLVDQAAELYMKNLKAILDGSNDLSLFDGSVGGCILQAFKSFAKRNLFRSKHAYDIELSGYGVVTGLLSAFLPILTLEAAEFEDLINDITKYGDFEFQKRLVWMLPRKHVLAYKYAVSENEAPEHILRMHLILDYISGMTDTHALKVFQLFGGIKIAVRA